MLNNYILFYVYHFIYILNVKRMKKKKERKEIISLYNNTIYIHLLLFIICNHHL
jgi:hypothetical protein